jgi:hypothetical protein
MRMSRTAGQAVRLAMAFLMLAGLARIAAAQKGEGELDPALPKGITTDEIIKRFAAREKQFTEARKEYVYRESVRVQTLDGDTVDGEYQQVFDITFDDKGKKLRQVIFAPQSTLQRIIMSREDFDDIENDFRFVITTDDLPLYDVLYKGQQKQDELDTYVFDIAPKQIEKGKRYFQGTVWVDQQDFQIVKSYGKPVPETRANKGKRNQQENLTPNFTTYREQIDGKYWFPTYAKADEDLHFVNETVHIRQIVKWSQYQHFSVTTTIKTALDGKEIPNAPETAKPEEKKK